MPRAAAEPIAPVDLVGLVRAGLADLGDPARAVAMAAYMKSEMAFRGVPSPLLKALCRDLFARCRLPDAAAWRAAVLLLWDEAAFREERYAAVVLAGHRAYAEHRGPGTLALYRHLVVSGAWWDHVDAVSHLVGDLLRTYREVVTPRLLDWAVADDLWLRRSAIIAQVGHRDALDQELLRAVCDANLDGSGRGAPPESAYGREFFVRKAIGWALRDHARADPQWVRSYVASRSDRLSGLSRREALKHLGPLA